MLLIWVMAVFLILIYIFTRITCGHARSKVCLVGKTAIVTGGNSGIGYQVALNLAARGCRIIIADKADASKTRDNLISETNNPNIITKKVDLASFESIRAFAEDIIKTEDKIDILINNAGLGGCPLIFTEDDIQVTWQVNHYGPFLLTHLLIGLLKKSAPSRIVFTSSILAYLTTMKEEDMVISKDFEDKAMIPICYRNSKLAVAICAKVFAAKLNGTGVTCNVLHPGLVLTPIYLDTYRIEGKIRGFVGHIITKMFGKTPEEGAQTTIHLSVANEVKNVTGRMFWDCRQFTMPSQVYNEAFCEKVWKISEDLTGLKDSEKLRS